MSEWTMFAERLPTADDANGTGLVMLKTQYGETRSGLWDWIRPDHPRAADTWAANGFFEWRRLRAEDPIYRPF